MTIIGLAIAGALGALTRVFVDKAVSARTDGTVPWGITVVNVSGSFVLGVVTGAAMAHGFGGTARLLLGTGFLGAYTTFSTYTVQTVQLLQRGAPVPAAVYAVGSIVTGVAAASAGMIAGGL